MTKHTKAPWKFKQGIDDNHSHQIYSEHGNGCLVALITRDAAGKEVANGRLMSAAPELLEALEYVIKAHDYRGAMTRGDAVLSPSIYNKLTEVIKKARGE